MVLKNTNMGVKNLNKILSSLNINDHERRAQFEVYFKSAPAWLIDSISLEKMKKGTIFVREGEPVDTIYLIGQGIVKATDYRICGISYDFMLFSKMYSYGVMEILMEQDTYQTTLQTVTDCTVIKVPKVLYSRWLKNDREVMQREARMMAEYLLEQARNSRAFLFLQGSNRLAYLFLNHYDKYAENGVLTIRSNRQELADFTGLCLKTITRSVKQFEERGLITRDRGKIRISHEQYQRLKKELSSILVET